MSPTVFMVIMSSLATGTIITSSSHHWLLAWIGLEINTMAMIPVISSTHNPRSTEAATKYFLTQAVASATILFSSMMNAWYLGTWDITNTSFTPAHTLLTIALAMKLGLAPAHFWLPEVLQGSTMTTALIITTWQKLAPMALIYMTINNLSTTILILTGLLSTLIGGWGGLNQTQTRKIMAYSSIAHLGWMIIISSMMTNILIISLSMYLIMTTAVFCLLILSKSKTIQDMMTAWPLSPALTSMTTLTLLSLAGMPPLTGFMPKWLILKEMLTQNLIPTATIMMLSTLLSLFFYLRLTYLITLTLPPNSNQTKLKWRFKPNFTTLLMTVTSTMSILLLPMTPMMLL
uniref:NADH-ubiquinone oxidoreductase chain 2 n=1 Tax=Anolis onca TaxID=323591 RepID=Q27U33_9SAUR|nr:NADH dehydrogenase subunit 2 [Anolis onca]ABD42975.1 NADH dehydrogenase subunit 2 [Anolis onca]ABD42977.1 NADH dehydrogenase subunit 2 [Anolis onca]